MNTVLFILALLFILGIIALYLGITVKLGKLYFESEGDEILDLLFGRCATSIIGILMNFGVLHVRNELPQVYHILSFIGILGIVLFGLAFVIAVLTVITVIIELISDSLYRHKLNKNYYIQEYINNIIDDIKDLNVDRDVISESTLNTLKHWHCLFGNGVLSYRSALAKFLKLTSKQLDEYKTLQLLDDSQLQSTTFTYGIRDIIPTLSKLEECATNFTKKEERKALELNKRHEQEVEIEKRKLEAQKTKDYILTRNKLDKLKAKQDKAGDKALRQIEGL